MPIYEYECSACGYQHEALQKISDPVLTKCPKCGEDALRKLISAAGFRLSGSGWYETDFKSGSKKNLHSSESDNKSSANKKTDSGAGAAEKGSKPSKTSTSDSKSSSAGGSSS